MKDIHGKAIRDYYQSKLKGALTLHNSYGDPEEMPVEVFFRDELDFTTLEHLAIMECTGKVLDLGAGAGAHSLALQGRGIDVFALENSPGCVEVMQQSAVKNTLFMDYRKHAKTYDTVLLMMNGLGLAGKLEDVVPFLLKCASLLKVGGQILLDSSDISYLYEDNEIETESYYGEVRYRYEYNSEMGSWFDWVYVDQDTLQSLAKKAGLQMEVLITDENDQYLARLTK